MKKSTVDEIRARFDGDVERFSNLETGQVATIDAEISLELLTEAAKRIRPNASHIMDLGCGAGNYTLKMLSKIPNLHCTMIDLSRPMLDRAYERVSKVTGQKIEILQGDIRDIALSYEQFDIILAGAVLHHLREDQDWEFVFKKLLDSLKKGGCLMISDLVTQEFSELNHFIWEKYGDYLESLGGQDYRNKVLAYIDKEDSPRSINFQFEVMKKVGFSGVEVFHKNLCFAAFGGIK